MFGCELAEELLTEVEGRTQPLTGRHLVIDTPSLLVYIEVLFCAGLKIGFNTGQRCAVLAVKLGVKVDIEVPDAGVVKVESDDSQHEHEVAGGHVDLSGGGLV